MPTTLGTHGTPTPTQSRIFWIALTALAVVALLASVATLVWALGQVLNLFGPVLWPLAIAAVLAYLLDPLVDLLERQKMPRQRAIIFVFAVAVFVMLGIAAMIVPRLIFETRELASRVPAYATIIQQRAVDWIENSAWRLPLLNESKDTSTAAATNLVANTEPVLTNAPAITQPEESWERKLASAAVSWLPRALPRIGYWLADQISRVAAWFGLFAGIALVPVYCFYFLLEKRGIQGKWTHYLPVQESRMKEELVFVLTSINDRLIVFFAGRCLSPPAKEFFTASGSSRSD